MSRAANRPFIFLLLVLCLQAAAVSQAVPGGSRPRVALVLEGGGALGLAHVGVIKVIEELGIPVDIVVGTSMGAIVGGFYSIGYDAARLERLALETDWLELLNETLRPQDEGHRDWKDRSRYFARIGFDRRGFKSGGGLLTGRKILSYVDYLTLDVPMPVEFDALPRRYRAVATDITTGERVVIDRGSLSDAMRASMGIPGAFVPYRLGNRYLVDGGVVDNLPIQVARELGADYIIAVDILGGTAVSPEEYGFSAWESLSKTLDIMIRNNVVRQLPFADFVFTVKLEGFTAADFLRGAEVIDIGEKTALAHRADLENFRAAIFGSSYREPSPAAAEPSAIGGLRVEGGEESDRKRVRALFGPLIGTIPEKELLAGAVAALDRTGLYDSIRLRRNAAGADSDLVVRLGRRPLPGNSLGVGLSLSATYTDSITSSQNLSSGAVIRGLTTPDSRFSADVELPDNPSVGLEFLQPFGSYLFAETFFSWKQDSVVIIADSSIRYLYQTKDASFGANVGTAFYRWARLSTGLRYDFINSERIPDIRAASDVEGVALSRTELSIALLDSPVFPFSGFSLDARLTAALPDSDLIGRFRTLEASGRFVTPFDFPLSVELDWIAGTDFSDNADDSAAAPAFYKPDMANRLLFPSPMPLNERIGSHTLGIGVMARYLLNRTTRAAGVPAFALFQADSGTVLQDAADAKNFLSYTHWNLGVGFGLRVNDGLGVLMRVGVYRGFGDSVFSPFVALDVGSFGY